MFANCLSEAAAVHLIERLLFGHRDAPLTPFKPSIRRTRCAAPCAPCLPDPVAVSNDNFFQSIVLRKRPARATPVTAPTPVTARTTHAPYVPSFPRSLCYLASVAPSDCAAAMLSLGSYPSLNSLLSSWLFQTTGLWLLESQPGLYHAVTTFVPGAIPVALGFADWAIGANNNPDFPPLPRYSGPRYFEDTSRAPPTSNNAPRKSGSRGLPSFPRNPGRGRGRGRAPSPAPFRVQPYNAPRAHGGAPPNIPCETWQDANRSDFDVAIDNMKASLEDFPCDIAVDTWNNLSAWLKDLLRNNGANKSNILPLVEAHFGSLLVSARRLADERQCAHDVSDNTHELSLQLSSQLKRLDELQQRRDSATLPANILALDAEINTLRASAHALETIVEEKENEHQADDTDDIAGNADFMPIDDPDTSIEVKSWPEDNYEDFATKRAALTTGLTVTTKLPLSSLIIQQKLPASSKILMPRAVEFFTADEIDTVTPKSVKSRWCNYYEDPVEPAKCWSRDEFSALYNKEGFHFMFARIAQAGVQFTDSKLSSLRSVLSSRWKTEVTFHRMRPRMDWMLATIPSLTDLSKEILGTSLIHLQDGNAVYVIRHFTAPAKVHNLEFTIANTVENPGALFSKLKKRCMEFEKSGVSLSWRVASVRPSDAPTKYRTTFYLDSPDEYWPWWYRWSHPHSSIPETIPLLNFDPSWKARKPYACAICYNSDHHGKECPLPHVRIGGVPLVSAVSRGLVIARKAAKRRTWSDRSLDPIPGGSKSLRPSADKSDKRSAPAVSADAPDIVDKGGDVIMANDDDGLATTHAQFNDPISQLKPIFPYILDDVLTTALTQGGSVDATVAILNRSHLLPPTPQQVASGSGLPPLPVPTASAAPTDHSKYDELADFIFGKLTCVFNKSGSMQRSDMIDLLHLHGGNIPQVVNALQDAGLKFSWPADEMKQDWEQWHDACITPQAATPLSLISNITMLQARSPAPAPTYYKEAQFLRQMFIQANVDHSANLDFDALCNTYKGQFPAILRKMHISHGITVPLLWTESYMTAAYSKWLIPSPHVSAPAVAPPQTMPPPPHNAVE